MSSPSAVGHETRLWPPRASIVGVPSASPATDNKPSMTTSNPSAQTSVHVPARRLVKTPAARAATARRIATAALCESPPNEADGGACSSTSSIRATPSGTPAYSASNGDRPSARQGNPSASAARNRRRSSSHNPCASSTKARAALRAVGTDPVPPWLSQGRRSARPATPIQPRPPSKEEKISRASPAGSTANRTPSAAMPA